MAAAAAAAAVAAFAVVAPRNVLSPLQGEALGAQGGGVELELVKHSVDLREEVLLVRGALRRAVGVELVERGGDDHLLGHRDAPQLAQVPAVILFIRLRFGQQ